MKNQETITPLEGMRLTPEEIEIFLQSCDYEPDGKRIVKLEFDGLYEQCATLSALLRMLEHGFNYLENLPTIKDETWDFLQLTQLAQQLVPLNSANFMDYVHKKGSNTL